MTIQEALKSAIDQLKSTSTSPSLDAEVLLAFVLKKDKKFLYMNPHKILGRTYVRTFKKLISRRIQGWPVAYLTGGKEFFGLKFKVNKDVLIPRPETETLVELVIKGLRGKGKGLRILDIGTGSGCVIISLAKNFTLNPEPLPLYFASDISKKALRVAKQNAKRHKVRITFKQGGLLIPWKKQKFDIIVANLPYLPKLIDPQTKFEPKKALLAKKNGLALIEKLLQQISSLTPHPSSLFLEFDPSQSKQIKKLAKKILPVYGSKIYKDLSGKKRFMTLSLLSQPSQA